jgi:uncharacterized protein (TIGR02118 family)
MEATMTVLRVCYKQGVRFDQNYYISKHMPLVSRIIGAAVQNIEVVKMASAADGSAPPYQMMFSAYFDSPAALESAMQNPRMPEVLGDVKNFYDGMPDLLIGEVVAVPSPA